MLLPMVLALGGLAALAGVDRAVVSAPAGAVSGTSDGAIHAYKGIPYAEPPVGNLRWREPQRAALWQGVRRATNFAPACPQIGVSMPGEAPPATSEDCLYLNVWTPVHSHRRRRHRSPLRCFAGHRGATSLPDRCAFHW